jgi:chaperonin GroES
VPKALISRTFRRILGLVAVSNPQFSNLWRTRMKFYPLADRVVIKRVKEETKSSGGIIIPDTAQEKPQEGEVVSVGPGARDEKGERIKPEVKVGDRILFGKWSGTEIKVDGEELLIMKESDIMGVLEGKPAVKKAA